jgi:hypothetical protein
MCDTLEPSHLLDFSVLLVLFLHLLLLFILVAQLVIADDFADLKHINA